MGVVDNLSSRPGPDRPSDPAGHTYRDGDDALMADCSHSGIPHTQWPLIKLYCSGKRTAI
jgi:hypothetical protein